MDEFWIGDWVRDIKTRSYGTFEGDSEGLAKVKINHSIHFIPQNRLELLTEKEVEAARISIQSEAVPVKKTNNSKNEIIFNDTLDLHIETLAPHLMGKQVELILNKQLEAAREHIESAISKRRLTIKIIHGKGTGALKMEIEHMLEDYSEVYFTKSVNNGGAIDVLFSYL